MNEKPELDQMRDNIEEIRDALAGMKKTIGEMYDALVGNAVLKDGGLVKKFDDLEQKLKELAKMHDGLKDKYNQIKWLILGMAFGAGILGFSLKDVIHFFIK